MTRLRLASGILLFLGGVMSFATFGGCGGGDDTTGKGGNGAGNPGGTMTLSGTQAGDPGSSVTFTTSGSGGGSMGSSTLSGGGGNCGGEEYTGEKLPLAMFIMLDKSGSMNDSAGTGTKWQAVTTALQAYINAPTSTGVEVGIAFFGIPSGLSNSCNAADYAMPIVPIAILPGNANALIQAINAVSPAGGTPTSASLEGGIMAARTYATANPNKKVIHVYVTDGDPTQCDTNLQTIYAIAGAGFSAMPSIQTYVIGVGPSLNALQGIAMAGGSGMPFLVDSSPQATQQFIDAMNAIQGNALTCTYTIPIPMSGMFDPMLVNVEYTPTGGTPQTLGYVPDQASCPPGGMAWYYDNPANPTLIMLCPDTCTTITADTTGSIRIVLGCPTEGPH